MAFPKPYLPDLFPTTDMIASFYIFQKNLTNVGKPFTFFAIHYNP